MFFYLHYVLMTSGLSSISVLVAVYFKTYSDASQSEIGAALMSFPFVGLITKPLFCSMADRKQAHKKFLLGALLVELLGYMPLIIIPFAPTFYTNHSRLAFYLEVLACHIGNAGLGVAWSLGDCLAMNSSQKSGIPYGRMRLMGTVSWGVYGFIIGQINEVDFLPKYLPAFFILQASILLEILLVVCWRDKVFEMIEDPFAGKEQQVDGAGPEEKPHQIEGFLDSTPSSLGGTLRLNSRTASALRDVFTPDDLHQRLAKSTAEGAAGQRGNGTLRLGQSVAERALEARRNPQLLLLKMILAEDGRVVKYIILFTIAGVFIAPMNFLFLSIEQVCRETGGCNFSQLAGCILVSQAAMETFTFLIIPPILLRLSRASLMGASFFIMLARFFFYQGWFYTTGISPYWAVIGEWGHGLGFAIPCTIMADVALMFANESRLFIPELRKFGYLSDSKELPREQVEAEERSIKMALRATMQALFGGFMDGLGMGAGNLLCGLLLELYSYTTLWQLFAAIALGSLLLHQLTELSRSRWSDTFRPKRGTKSWEIMQLNGMSPTSSPGGLSAVPDQEISGAKPNKVAAEFC